MEQEANIVKSIQHLVSLFAIAYSGFRLVSALLTQHVDIDGDRNVVMDLLAYPAAEEVNQIKVSVVAAEDVNQIKGKEIYFPDEIIMEILSRLPVQPLLRFKSVSKLWNKEINEPTFKRKHLNHAKNNQNHQKLLLCPAHSGEMVAFKCSLSSVRQSKVKIEVPSNFKPSFHNIFGCCDGLYLMRCGHTLLLWNPSTRESILLPQAAYPQDGRNIKYGLGYDSTSDDYKILMLPVSLTGNLLPIGHDPYSKMLALKSGSWRKIAKHHRGFRYWGNIDTLAFLHGAFHWVGEDISSSKYYVVSFSLSNEVYREMPLPELTFNMPCVIYRGVTVMGGLLYAYYTCRFEESTTFKLWAMNDYGAKESWSEIFSIQDTSLSFVSPKYMFADGDVLLHAVAKTGKKRFGFRTSKGPSKLFLAHAGYQQGFVCVESLISPKLLM